MKKKEKKYDLYDENIALIKSLNDQYFNWYQEIEAYVFRHQSKA